MQHVRISGRRAMASGATLSLAVMIALAGCTAGSGGKGGGGGPGKTAATSGPASSQPTGSSTSAAPAAEVAVITTQPAAAADRISPTEPISVSIAHGKLTSVTVVNATGRNVKGTLAADAGSWRSTEPLGYDKTYRLTAVGTNSDGVAVTKKSTVTTVAPDNMTMPSITDIYGTGLAKGGVYGVGMVVRVHFDEAVNEALAEKTLSVSTSPKVTGGWYWRDNQNAFWRPEKYYPSGTKVKVSADVYGKKVGKGLYGQDDTSASFTIGQKRVSVANPKTHHVKVYFDDKLVRNMPTSMGKGGYEPGTSIHYWTMYGTYTVITHENPATMSAGSYGVPKSSPNYYPPEKIYWSTKISTDGIYLHELNTTIWAQGHQNVSHGCLNLRTSNAKWFYHHSRVGDVVRVTKGLGNPRIAFDQGGQWSVPWSTWLKGSALR